MASTVKMAIAGLGAAGAAGVAFVAVPDQGSERSAASVNAQPFEVCLKSDIEFFEGVTARCYSQEELARLADAPLKGGNGGKAFASLSHPTDMQAGTREVATCRDYRKAHGEGWYALSGAAMRHEAYFIRACGVLSMLMEAQAPDHSFFKEGSPTAGDIKALSAGFSFGEASAAEGAVKVNKEPGHQWRIDAGNLSVGLTEIANADFDNDGVEEILAFSSEAPKGGTASHYQTGLIQKDAANAAVTFTPVTFAGDEGAGASG